MGLTEAPHRHKESQPITLHKEAPLMSGLLANAILRPKEFGDLAGAISKNTLVATGMVHAMRFHLDITGITANLAGQSHNPETTAVLMCRLGQECHGKLKDQGKDVHEEVLAALDNGPVTPRAVLTLDDLIHDLQRDLAEKRTPQAVAFRDSNYRAYFDLAFKLQDPSYTQKIPTFEPPVKYEPVLNGANDRVIGVNMNLTIPGSFPDAAQLTAILPDFFKPQNAKQAEIDYPVDTEIGLMLRLLKGGDALLRSIADRIKEIIRIQTTRQQLGILPDTFVGTYADKMVQLGAIARSQPPSTSNED